MSEQKSKIFLAILLAIISVTVLAVASYNFFPITIITIKADGSIDPDGAPIQRSGDTYILTNDADGITVNRSNIALNGNGHTLSQTLTLQNVTNATIKNFKIIISNAMDNIFLNGCSNITISNNTITSSPESESFSLGITVWGGTSNVITGNRIINNVNGITFESTTSNNRVFDNIITGNIRGLWIQGSQNNVIYNNNFDNNTTNVFILSVTAGTSSINIFDNGTTGNYWSDYTGTDANGDGIGDTPYVIDASNRDRYPLMEPASIL